MVAPRRALGIPVASLRVAKSRLEPYFDRMFLQHLVTAMLEDVVQAALKSQVFDTILIYSPDERIQALAGKWRVQFKKEENPQQNLACSLTDLTRIASEDFRASSLLICFSDLPLLLPQDYSDCYALCEDLCVVASPSVGGGCNFFLRTPPDAVPLEFDTNPRPSFLSLTQAAMDRGIPCKIFSSLRALWDFDIIEDLILGAQLLELTKPQSPTLALLKPELGRFELQKGKDSRAVKVVLKS